MSSIAALQQQINQLDQKKQAKAQEIAKVQRHGVMEAALGETNKAIGDQQVAQHDRQDIEQYDKQIADLQRQITDLQRQVTNIEAKISDRNNQHVADQQRLEQQFKLDIQQLESEKARLIG